MLLQHLFDIHSLAAKHAGCTSQCDISLVSGVHHVGEFAALCNDQLRILTYSRRNRRGVPVEPEASRSRGLSVTGSYGCGWNTHQSEREPGKAYEESHTGDGETLSGAARKLKQITPGNVHDNVAFDTVFERLTAHHPEVQEVTADAGYKTPWICKPNYDIERIPSLPTSDR